MNGQFPCPRRLQFFIPLLFVLLAGSAWASKEFNEAESAIMRGNLGKLESQLSKHSELARSKDKYGWTLLNIAARKQ